LFAVAVIVVDDGKHCPGSGSCLLTIQVSCPLGRSGPVKPAPVHAARALATVIVTMFGTT